MEEIVFTKMSVLELKELITECVLEILKVQSKPTHKQEKKSFT